MSEDTNGVEEMEKVSGCQGNHGKEMEKEEKDIRGPRTEDGAVMEIMNRTGGMMTIGIAAGKAEKIGYIEAIGAGREDSECIHLQERKK